MLTLVIRSSTSDYYYLINIFKIYTESALNEVLKKKKKKKKRCHDFLVKYCFKKTEHPFQTNNNG